MLKKVLFAATLCLLFGPVAADDGRVTVKLPEMMREHMLSNMRDHLLALEEITRFLASRTSWCITHGKVYA